MPRENLVLGEEEHRRALAAAERWRGRSAFREARASAIKDKRYARADEPERFAKRLQRLREWRAAVARRAPGGRAGDAFESALRNGSGRPLRPEDVTEEAKESVIGATRDILSVEFLEIGLDAARCVGRVTTDGAANGTGFLVGRDLMLTNHHVLPAEAVAEGSRLELDFEENLFGTAKPMEAFGLRPDRFFLADERLDFALVAVEPLSARNGVPLARYGFKPLIGEEGKVAVAECVNLIQHPGSEPKRVVVRNNQLIDLFADGPDLPFFHYLADTEKGSSGSPVFTDQWELVALHHQAVPKTDLQGRLVDRDGVAIGADGDRGRIVWVANEGIRVSRIVRFVEQAALADSGQDKIRRDLLACWEKTSAPVAQLEAVAARRDLRTPRGTRSPAPTAAACHFQDTGNSFCSDCSLPARENFSLENIEVGKKDLLGNQIKKLLWAEPDLKVFLTEAGVFTCYSDCAKRAKEQGRLYKDVSPLLAHLRFLTCRMYSGREFYYNEFANSVVQALKGHTNEARSHLKEIIDLAMEQVTNQNRVNYFLACGATALAVAASAVYVIRAFGSDIDPYAIAALAGALGAAFSIAISFRRFELVPCQTTQMNYVVGALRVLIGATSAAVLLLAIRSGLGQDLAQAILGGTKAAAAEPGLEPALGRVSMLGFLAGFAERLVPDMLSGAVDRVAALHKRSMTPGTPGTDQANAASPGSG